MVQYNITYMTYNLIGDDSWFCKRTCSNCGKTATIRRYDIVYSRNKWTLGMKKECYTYCDCGNKLHVSKRFIPDIILNDVKKNRRTDAKQYMHRLNYDKIKSGRIQTICSNCHEKEVITYEDAMIKRRTNDGFDYLVTLYGRPFVYYVCKTCGCENSLTSSSTFKSVMAIVKERIGEYDRTHKWENTKNLLKSLPFKIIAYGLFSVPFLMLSPVFLCIEISESFKSKDKTP